MIDLGDDEEEDVLRWRKLYQSRPRYQELVVTTGKEMPDCETEVFKNGTPVAFCAFGKGFAEEFSILMRKEGLRVDWYFSSARQMPRLATLDDPKVVLEKWRKFIREKRAANIIPESLNDRSIQRPNRRKHLV